MTGRLPSTFCPAKLIQLVEPVEPDGVPDAVATVGGGAVSGRQVTDNQPGADHEGHAGVSIERVASGAEVTMWLGVAGGALLRGHHTPWFYGDRVFELA